MFQPVPLAQGGFKTSFWKSQSTWYLQLFESCCLKFLGSGHFQFWSQIDVAISEPWSLPSHHFIMVHFPKPVGYSGLPGINHRKRQAVARHIEVLNLRGALLRSHGEGDCLRDDLWHMAIDKPGWKMNLPILWIWNLKKKTNEDRMGSSSTQLDPIAGSIMGFTSKYGLFWESTQLNPISCSCEAYMPGLSWEARLRGLFQPRTVRWKQNRWRNGKFVKSGFSMLAMVNRKWVWSWNSWKPPSKSYRNLWKGYTMADHLWCE